MADTGTGRDFKVQIVINNEKKPLRKAKEGQTLAQFVQAVATEHNLRSFTTYFNGRAISNKSGGEDLQGIISKMPLGVPARLELMVKEARG